MNELTVELCESIHGHSGGARHKLQQADALLRVHQEHRLRKQGQVLRERGSNSYYYKKLLWDLRGTRHTSYCLHT